MALPVWPGAVVLILTPAVSHAEQFVLFDVTFTFTKADADFVEAEQVALLCPAATLSTRTVPETGRLRWTIGMGRSTSVRK